jgi:small subunit ribosomal protein S6
MATLQSLADAPGRKREYETIFILAPDTQNADVAQLNARLKGIIEDMGGAIVRVDNWGKRKLAYEVQKNLKGIYLYWQYLGSAGLVEELERNLRLLDPVIRYMTVKVDENIDPTARPSEMDDAAYDRAATTAADEEDLVMGTSSDRDDGEGVGRRDDDKSDGDGDRNRNRDDREDRDDRGSRAESDGARDDAGDGPGQGRGQGKDDGADSNDKD